MNKNLKTIANVREKKRESSNINTVGVDDSVDPYKQKHINKYMSNIPTSNIQHLTSNVAITLIALIITIIVLLILAGVTLNMVMGDSGIFSKANIASENTKIETAKEIIRLAVLENQTYKITNDLNVKDDKKLKELIEGKLKEEGYEIEDGKITIGNTEIDIAKEIKDILAERTDEDSNNNKELQKYKKVIANTLTDLGVKTLETQTIDEYIKNIDILADKNYEEGKDSNIVLIKSNLSSRYEQTLSLSNIEGYKSFDDDDFIIVNKNMLCENRNDREDILTMTKKFDKQTGILILGKQKSFASRNSWTFWNIYDLYAIKRNIKEIETGKIKTSFSKENLEEFKNKLAKTLEKYGIENKQEDPLENKTDEEISEYIKTIAKNKFKDGISTYMLLIKENLSTRYNQSVDVSNVEGYQNLTIDDFLIINKNISYEGINDYVEVQTMAKEYNANTGTLEFGMQKSFSDIWTFWNTCDVYLIKKEIINLEN